MNSAAKNRRITCKIKLWTIESRGNQSRKKSGYVDLGGEFLFLFSKINENLNKSIVLSGIVFFSTLNPYKQYVSNEGNENFFVSLNFFEGI